MLDDMEGYGRLVSKRVIQNEKPNKRVYSITDQGKNELAKWLAEPEADISHAVQIKNAFLTRMFFAGAKEDQGMSKQWLTPTHWASGLLII